jgi:hypothetical protein
MRLIPSLVVFVLSERRDLGLCAGTGRGSRTIANLRSAIVRSIRTSAISSLLKPLPSTEFFNHLLYCYEGIPSPEGSKKRRHHPPRLQSAAPCQAGSGGSQNGGNTVTCATFALTFPRFTWATLALAYLQPAASVRGCWEMLGSLCDSVHIRRASVEGRPSL